MNTSSPRIHTCIRDEQGRLTLQDDRGAAYRDVRPVRLFPITDPDGWISLCNDQGEELFCIESLTAVPDDFRRLLLEELNRCMFTPVIKQILSAFPMGDQLRLALETDRGETEITLDTEDMYRLSGNRILIKDLSGIRYLIPDWHAMNPQSRRILDTYI